ncbi:putative membrane protein [Anaerosolibacter carboniphilus]|uniref:Putative membrane protein n=1 Tax=Anaerosolibacter carboniphilus TaxID=1417629 RepID=A0A841KPQ9_9FIRM|nr:ECF transporter S component [Anaerosolibacter carboniphilus]MBB6215311.1 putative membrane protein [Anaerosolibacter carboniphilus]
MENNFVGAKKASSKTKDVTISGLLIALVFIATKFINLRLPISMNGGLIHLGNTMLFMAAIVFGKKKGALAGSVGMALFDMVSGWMAWAPFTFVVRGIMGYVIGSISHSSGRNGNNLLWNMAAILIGGIWMLFGYYVTEVILYGNWVSPVTSIPGNVVQIIAGAVLGLPVITAIKKTKLF